MGNEQFTFGAVVERHHPEMPAYLIVPERFPKRLGKAGTFVADATVQGEPFGRRTIKPWGDGRWFMGFTAAFLKKIKCDVGDAVRVTLSLADEREPRELAAALAAAPARVRSAWASLTAAQRRQLCEDVRLAKRQETREARAAKIIDRLGGRGSRRGA